MKTKILQEFLNSTLEIKSQEKLKQYIQFCITNNQQEKIKGKTSYHHILPQANSCFPKYSNLKENPWNGTHLLYSDHYYAHYLFTEAVSNYSQLSAFCAMNNTDIKNGRIEEKDLIPAEEFQKKMEERSENHSQWYRDNPEKVDEKIKKYIKTINKGEKEKSILTLKTAKAHKTLKIISEVDGIDTYTRRARKARDTKKRDFVNKDGIITNTDKETGLKISKYLNKMIEYKGKKITQSQYNAKKMVKTRTRKVEFEGELITEYRKTAILRERKKDIVSPKYNIISEKEIIKSNVLFKEIHKISQTFIKKSKTNPLGATRYYKELLIKRGYEEYIGCWVELI